MDTAEILHLLEKETGTFPRTAVEAAVARREEIIPELLRVLEKTLDQAAQLADVPGYIAHLYAMLLLAQFRETRAYPLVVRFALLPNDLLDPLCGDFVTEDLGRVLASVCGGDPSGIQSVIENEEADEWARGAALGSLVTLVAAGQVGRDEIVNYFAGLFRGKLKRTWSHVWDRLVACSADLYAAELIGDIEQAYAEGLVDPDYIGLDEVQQDLATGQDRALARLADNTHLRMVKDTVAEMSWWACFHEAPVKRTPPAAPYASLMELAAPSPIRKAEPKTGRNEPCPCRSGKKYKKCCGA